MTTNATLKRFLRLAMSEGRCSNDRHSTFTHNALSWRLANVWLVALALICCCSGAFGQQSLEARQLEKVRVFTGRWITEAATPDGITRLEINSDASAIFIRAWAACPQGECEWGQISIKISAAEAGELSVTFAPAGRIDILRITPLSDRRLRVARRTTYADRRPPQDATQEFVWLPNPTWGVTPLSNVFVREWPVVSSSVIVFFAKQPSGELAPVGSGLLVQPSVVATNYKVVKNATHLQARLAVQSALRPVLEVVNVDEAHDVAFVRVEGLGGWPLRLNVSRELVVKDPVFVITNVTDGTISSGEVSSVSVVNGVSRIEITAPFSPVESGAPVFNRYGSVVGISASNPAGADKPGLVIPARYLIALTPNNLAQPHAPASTLDSVVDSRPVLQPQQLKKVRMLSGRWTAESPGTDGITRLEIASNGSAISIRVWAACRQEECDWGQSSIIVSAAEAEAGLLSFRFAAPTGVTFLKVSLLPDRGLRAAWHTMSADPHPSPDRIQELAWLSVLPWEYSFDSPQGSWPAVSPSVVVFFAKHASGDLAPVGSGLLVRHNLVATSYDVAKNGTQLQVRLAAQSALCPVLEIVKVDEGHTVALVRVEGLRGWPLPLYDRKVAVKEKVFVITNVTDRTVSSCEVSSVSVVNGVSRIEIAAPFSPFESGAPVFNKNGVVVGISTSKPEGAKKPGLVIPARRLAALMPDPPQPLAAQPTVDSRPVLINSVQPRYTEEAEHRRVSGKVTMRVLVGADGKVKRVIVMWGLPYGLDEQAIQALYQTRFKPAMKDGQPVDFWTTAEAEFALRK